MDTLASKGTSNDCSVALCTLVSPAWEAKVRLAFGNSQTGPTVVSKKLIVFPGPVMVITPVVKIGAEAAALTVRVAGVTALVGETVNQLAEELAVIGTEGLVLVTVIVRESGGSRYGGAIACEAAMVACAWTLRVIGIWNSKGEAFDEKAPATTP